MWFGIFQRHLSLPLSVWVGGCGCVLGGVLCVPGQRNTRAGLAPFFGAGETPWSGSGHCGVCLLLFLMSSLSICSLPPPLTTTTTHTSAHRLSLLVLCACTRASVCPVLSVSLFQPDVLSRMSWGTNTHARTHTHTRARARTHTRTLHTRTHQPTYAHLYTDRVDGGTEATGTRVRRDADVWPVPRHFW